MFCLEEIQNEGRNLYKQALGEVFQENRLVIMIHQGYSMFYINIDEFNEGKQNVYLLVYGDFTSHEKEYCSLKDWVFDQTLKYDRPSNSM